MLPRPERIAALVDSIGTDRFGPALLSLFGDDAAVVHGVGIECRRGAPPRLFCAVAREPAEQARVAALVQQWSSSDHGDDPILEWARQIATPSPTTGFRDALQACRNAQDRAFFERYYGSFRLGEEVDCVAADGDRLLLLSLCRRRGEGPFDPRRREALSAMAPLLLAIARQHAERSMPLTRVEKLARLRSEMKACGVGLTSREAEICAHIVLGYSAEAIGLQLGISAQTVASHRKRAYAKLGIGSQTQLFAQWLDRGLSDLLPRPGAAPGCAGP